MAEPWNAFDEIMQVDTASEPATKPGRWNAFDEIMPQDQPQPAQQQTQQPRTWGQYAQETVDYITGSDIDPKFKDVEGFSFLSDTPAPKGQIDVSGVARGIGASLFGATDAQRADIIKAQLGDNFEGFIEDNKGRKIVQFSDAQGQQQKRYVNSPEWESTDITRLIGGALPYAATGAATAVAGPAGLVPQAIAQGGIAALTSAGGDVAQTQIGSEQNPRTFGIDPLKTALTGGLSFAGSAAAQGIPRLARALWNRNLVDRKTGQLSAKGVEAAKKAGYNPDDLTGYLQREIADQLKKGRSLAQSRVAVKSDDEFGIVSTAGQRSKDAEQLFDEEVIRKGGYGTDAKEKLLAVDQMQRDRVVEAVQGGPNAPASIARQIDPNFNPAASQSDFGARIQEGFKRAKDVAKSAADEAWKDVPDLKPTDEALGNLPQFVSSKIDDLANEGLAIDTAPGSQSVTPMAAKMREQVIDFIERKGSAGSDEVISTGASPQTVDQMRRRLGGMVGQAKSENGDKAIAGGIYQAFNDWIDDSAQKALLAGDNKAASQLSKARSITRQMKRIFNPSGTQSQRAAAKKLELLTSDDITPDSVISEILGGSATSTPKGRTMPTMIRSIKVAANRYLPKDEAKDLVNSLRSAHWSRVVRDKKGEVHTPGRLLSNMKEMFEKQGALMKELYTQQEIATMRRLMSRVEDITYQPPQPSNSMVFGIAKTKQALEALGNMFLGAPGRVIGRRLDKVGSQYLGNVSGDKALQKALPDTSRGSARMSPRTGAAVSAGADALSDILLDRK